MAKRNRGSLTHQIEKELVNKLTPGQSKRDAKLEGIAKDHIYGYGTLKNYLQHCNNFAKWVHNNDKAIRWFGHKPKTLNECRQFVDDYLKYREGAGFSKATIKAEACAIAKLYGCSTKDFYHTKPRERKDITRSRQREGIQMDKHFSLYRNADFIKFCQSVGLRRSEIKYLKGNKLIERDGQFFIKVDVGGKGGRIREAPIRDNVDFVVAKMQEAGDNHVWDKVPVNADIHSYRAEYATNYYNSMARPIKDISHTERIIYNRAGQIIKTYDSGTKGIDRSQAPDLWYQDKKTGDWKLKDGCKDESSLYCCKKDLAKVWYDRKAMIEVSHALGHNRVSVIAGHYIRATHS